MEVLPDERAHQDFEAAYAMSLFISARRPAISRFNSLSMVGQLQVPVAPLPIFFLILTFFVLFSTLTIENRNATNASSFAEHVGAILISSCFSNLVTVRFLIFCAAMKF